VSRLRVRWLGRVPYTEADELQRALLERGADDYLLLLEHPHVYTLGKSADPAHVLVPPASVGADLVRADRGGDVTYHGPGQLVGYPIVTLPEWRAGQRDVVAYVRRLEAVLISALGDLGVEAERDDGYTGVWVGGEKIAAIGVRVSRGRTRHGFALNVNPDLSMFGHIVPCGIADRGVTFTRRATRLGARHARRRRRRHRPLHRALPLPGRRTPGRRLARAGLRPLRLQPRSPSLGGRRWGSAYFWGRRSGRSLPGRLRWAGRDPGRRPEPSERSEGGEQGLGPGPIAVRERPRRCGGTHHAGALRRPVTHRCACSCRLAEAGVEAPAEDPAFRRPEWMKVKADLGPNYRETKRIMRGLSLPHGVRGGGLPPTSTNAGPTRRPRS